MIKIKVFLYDSSKTNYRGTEYTDYVLQGSENVEDITQELDTSQITLMGISKNVGFTPSTKFILIVCDGDTEVEELHRMVDTDIVTQPILSDEIYFKHSISFYEPSVIAQKRIVDNIACTYKLKDVSLVAQSTVSETDQAKFDNTSDFYTPTDNFSFKKCSKEYSTREYGLTGKRFEYDGKTLIVDKNGATHTKLNNLLSLFGDETSGYHAIFRIPKLKILYGQENTKNFVYIGDASIDYVIQEYSIDGTATTNKVSGSIISNSNLYSSQITKYSYGTSTVFDEIKKEWLVESFVDNNPTIIEQYIPYLQKYTDTSASTPSYDITMEVHSNCHYIVTTSLHKFDDEVPTTPTGVMVAYKYTDDLPTLSFVESGFYNTFTNTYTYLLSNKNNESINTLNSSIQFNVYTGDTVTELLISGNPYSAYLLLTKAILNSELRAKMKNVGVGQLDYNSNGELAYDCGFYIDPNYQTELAKTTVIENFYNQKNLWEIAIEVGYYIHAVPELKFGKNDKLMFTFDRLGETKETNGNSTPVAITNFRGIDDYIAETDSYVTNMVQLGGYITERVAPKSSNENYLVYNDVVEIQTSKPIIELLHFTIYTNKTITLISSSGKSETFEAGSHTSSIKSTDKTDATNYVFEKNVYGILPIEYNVFPNKGVSLYYTLSDNKIVGCSYQLPQENTNVFTDYALKKIIYCAFMNEYPATQSVAEMSSGLWTGICCNDFTFEITYRTQDSVRQTHTRPDIRKFLLTNKWDNFPILKQFNNQEDVVVDSEKFGSNMYGTLIRTGNNTYNRQEWVATPELLKHKGEIYKINNEIYYVAKISSTYYTNYIMSVVEYSKDYNQLSKVVGIPSEPRFYEISEQSLIEREVSIDDFILLTDNEDLVQDKSYDKTFYLQNKDHLFDLIFGSSYDIEFAKYVVTTFKGDKDIGYYSSTYGEATLYTEILTPLNAYSSMGTLTYEWDMKDNYSAGDKVVEPLADNSKLPSWWITRNHFDSDNAYKSLEAVKYTDQYGKATLFDFYILEKLDSALTAEQVQAIPESPYNTKFGVNDTREEISNLNILATNVIAYDTNYNGRGLTLIKDCREKISFNYNIHLITSSDRFVISPFVFTPKEDTNEKPVKSYIVLLSEEVNKLSNGYFSNSNVIILDGVETYDWGATEETGTSPFGKEVTTKFQINIKDALANIDANYFGTSTESYVKVKAIAFTYNFDFQDAYGKSKFILARNVSDLEKEEATSDWYIGSPILDKIFTNKQ